MPPPAARTLAALLLLQPTLFAVPMVVLGAAIGWPGSLRLPAGEILPLIHSNAATVQLGYWAYLLVSLAMVPLAFALRAWFIAHGQPAWPHDALAFLGATAGILKTLGIVRWLAAMPTLATLHAAPAAPRAEIELAFTALNAYAGAVGELLGVQLASGLWMLGAGLALTRAGMVWPGRALALAGLLFLVTCFRTFLPAAAAVQTVAVPVALLALASTAFAFVRSRQPNIATAA